MKLTDNPLALVTGASAGIGAASARALHAAGAQVLLAARRTDRLQALAEKLPGSETVQLDVRDPSAVQAALADRAIDIAVLNAGLARGAGPLQEGNSADWDEMLDTNVKGVLHCARAVLPGMLERGAGDMVLLGSVAGRQVYPGGNVYNASKFAVHALYQALRLDAGGRGVRFTTLDPGMVETEFAEVRYRGDKAQAKAVYEGMQPLTPEDVADALIYAVTRPAHVNVGEIVLWPTCQSSTRDVART
ncbi:MAG: SDR family NAD(P)-dependent oxidoreductase [Planctomycetota bacterium]|jgi:NADP-dependent 3-hydroxy acid dehydrogenase YdfG|nr:SDR family NAD(P)-dependent oxidoreductase [Planctomycetota bacterium]MDP6938641.1 SDR family NAD(P)-dependent oxidoreductase [Planctomycetota bacterium]